jgi:hypothetical protein
MKKYHPEDIGRSSGSVGDLPPALRADYFVQAALGSIYV